MFGTDVHATLTVPAVQFPAMSIHAQARLQQRGIRRDVLASLIAYGRREHDHAHCEIVYFDGKAIEHLHREVGHQAALQAFDYRNVYAVLDADGRVVTTGHRYKRVLRDRSLSSFRPGRHRRPGRARTTMFGTNTTTV